MNVTLRSTLVSAVLAAAVQAAPFMAIGDGAELFLTGKLGVRSDDNVLLSSRAESDLIFEFAPGVDLTFGKNAQLQGVLSLVDTFTNYSDNSNLNTNLFAGNFRSVFDDGKMRLGLDVGYTEQNQNSAFVRGLIRRDVFNTGATTEVEVSQLTRIGAGITFAHENYKRRGFTDSDSLSVPLDIFYKWTNKTDLSVGYRYRDYRVDIGSDSTDHFFNIGARGEFSPKLKGRFAIGLNTRKLDRGGDDTLLGVESGFTYELSPKTNVDFNLSNDFSTSPQGEQLKNFVIGGSVSSAISAEWAVKAGLSLRSLEYARRTDDFVEGELGATYTVNANVRVGGSYIYRNYSSAIGAAEFKNNVFAITANFRY